MPKIVGRRFGKDAEVEVEVSLVAGTKKVRLDPRFTGPNAVFKLPQVFMKVLAKRSLTDIRILAESSRQYMVDRIYAGKAGASRKVATKPIFPHTQPNSAAKPFMLQPLTKKYRRWKKLKKLDGRLLIALGDYTRALEVKKVKRSGTDVAYLMTISPQKRHKERRPGKKKLQSLTMRQLAAVLEFGSSSRMIPGRPHWKPTAKEMTRRFKKAPDKMLASALRDFLRKAKGA
jgi:hypothetical protein